MVNTKCDVTSYDCCDYERKINDANTLYDAYILAKKSSDWKGFVQKFERNWLSELGKLQNELNSGSYRLREPNSFVVSERGKTRIIFGDHIRDRVVKHALCDNELLEDVLPYLIYDNGASLRGKGLAFTRKRLETHLHRYYRKYGTNEGYILLMDYSKYYDNIIRSVLLDMLEDKINNDLAWQLITTIIDDQNGEKGLRIGDQTAQIAGIYYPTRRDNYIKIVKGCKYYDRYMDDSVIFSRSKEFLIDLWHELDAMQETDGIILNPKKTYICRLSDYWRFCQIQYSLTETGRVIHKINPKRVTRMRRRMKRLCYILPYEDFANWYRSWFNECKRYMSRRQRENFDTLFTTLCKEVY